jgi:hypothetical protein
MQWENVNPRGSGNGRLQWKIDKKSTAKPVITGSKVIEGKKFYVDRSGNEYLAEAYDKMWGKVKELI